MNTMISDEDLIRYCDLEMSPEERVGFEVALAGDPELSERLETLRQSDRQLRAWNSQIDADSLAPIDLDHVPGASRWSFSMPLALAASAALVAIGIVIGTGISEQEVVTVVNVDDNTRNMHSTLFSALEKAPSFKPVSWQNPEVGSRGEATIKRTWQLQSGNYCREYTYAYYQAGGERSVEHGAACRNDAGEWRINLRVYPSGDDMSPSLQTVLKQQA